jgi:serine/threonine-protein kinase
MSPQPPTPEHNDPLLGQQVGEFRVERMIAAGGMGAVYLLRHALLPNTRKVLKVILPGLSNVPHVRARFLAEADALSQLGNHPSIVGIDTHMTLPGGQLAIMMPFCEGVPLDEYVKRHGGRLAPHRAFYVACHVARALHHAHTHDIVHRDLKPSNVFVEEDDNDWAKCKLLDFGVARRLNPNPGMPTQTYSGPCGTPDFMPPEQHDRAAEATSAADVFSFAVMLWWMVTGGYPWGQQDDPGILYMRKVSTQPDPPLGNALPAEWERWLRAALQPDPTARPTLRQLMQGLAQALPAVGRFVLSGPEILQKLARVLAEENDPDDPTLRNSSSRTLQPPWPALDLGAQAAAPPSAGAAARAAAQGSQPATVSERAGAMAAPAAVASGPAQNMRDASAPAAAGAPSALAAALVDPMPASAAAPHAAAPASARAAPGILGPPVAPFVSPARAPMAPVSPMATTIGASSGAVVSAPSTPPKWKLAIVGAMAVVVAGGGTFAIATLGGHRSATESSITRQPPATPPPPSTSAAIAPPARSSAPLAPAAPAPAEPARVTSPIGEPATATAIPATSVSGAPAGSTTIAPVPALTGKRRSGAQPDPTKSAAARDRAPTRSVDPGEHNKATSDHSTDRKFDRNAIVGGEED